LLKSLEIAEKAGLLPEDFDLAGLDEADKKEEEAEDEHAFSCSNSS